MDDTLEKVVHMALTAMCSQHLQNTTGTPIVLFLVHNQSNLEWKAQIEQVLDIHQEHYHTRWPYMARYAQHMFKL
jgi:hypothetical protein